MRSCAFWWVRGHPRVLHRAGAPARAPPVENRFSVSVRFLRSGVALNAVPSIMELEPSAVELVDGTLLDLAREDSDPEQPRFGNSSVAILAPCSSSSSRDRTETG